MEINLIAVKRVTLATANKLCVLSLRTIVPFNNSKRTLLNSLVFFIVKSANKTDQEKYENNAAPSFLNTIAKIITIVQTIIDTI